MELPPEEPVEERAVPSKDVSAGGGTPAEAAPPADATGVTADPGSPPNPPTYWETPGANTALDGAAADGWRGAGSVLGRSLDAYGSALPLFVALAAPEAIFAAVSVYAAANVAANVIATLMTFLSGLLISAAMMFATDDLGRGVKPEFMTTLDRAAGRIVPLFLMTLALVGIFIGLVFIAAVGGVLATLGGGGTGAGVVFGLLVVAAVILAAFFGLRWALGSPAVVLDGLGPISGLNRSRELTRRHIWRFVGLYLALGLLLFLLTTGTSLLSAYAPARAFAAVGVGVAVLVGTPLAAIVLAIAYRDLAGPGTDTVIGVPTGRGRRTAVIATVGTGFLVFAAGIWAVSNAGGQVFDPDRGHVIAGTIQNRASLCRPENRKTTFETTDNIWVTAIFTKRVPAGENIVVEYFVGNTSLGSATLTAEAPGLDCYYETQALRGAEPGTYRITVTYASAVIADGSFTVR